MNPWIAQNWRSKFVRIGWTMTTLVKVQMSSLVNTMSIHWWKELNMDERNTCNFFRPMWKLASCTMMAKVSRTTSWIHVHLLPWEQHKRWIPIGSMGCVHTHQRIPTIEGCGSPNRIRSVAKKIGKNNQKAGKLVKL